MRSSSLIVLTGFALSIVSAAADEGKPRYPASRTDNVVDILHGIKIVDPYRWLEDGNSAEVKEWVDGQNQFTQSMLGKLPGRKIIRERLSKLLEIGSLGTPVPVKGKYFFTRREGTQNQPILYVREGLDGKDRVLIDPNTLAKDGTVALDWWYPNRDGSLLAYGLSKDGSEQSTLYVKNVESGKDLSDMIERTRYSSVAWLPDGKGFYYTRYPAVGSVPKGQENYNRHVFFHKLGDEPKNDAKVFGEGRPAEDMLTVQISPDGRWLAVTAFQGWAKSEIFFRDNSKPDSKFFPLVEKTEAVFNVILRNRWLYVLTNDQAPRYRLFRVDPVQPGRQRWSEIIVQGPDKLETVAAIGDYLVAEYMHDAASRLQLLDRDGKRIEDFSLPTLGTVSGLGGEWDGDEFFFGFQSFTVASEIYRVDLKSRKRSQWGRVEAGIDSSRYQVEQVKYRSRDGTEIPMFLAHKKGIERDGNNPTLLYGYGGFNISLTPMFSPSRFLFLEQGGVLAIANLRGGGEYGEDWHRAGMRDKKQNTFDDFLAAARWLIDNKVTSPKRLTIQGGSNGGLLVGAALTQQPDLFKAVVCQVPLLDMLRYHKFLIARLWIPEYGSADDAEQYKFLAAYSPYQKVKDGTSYPAVLLTTAAADSRVDPLHARKMAARLQRASMSASPILLRQETRAGHGAGKPRGLILDELTDVYSFLFWQLGMNPELVYVSRSPDAVVDVLLRARSVNKRAKRLTCMELNPMDDGFPDLPLPDPRHPFHAHHMEMALEEAAIAVDEDEVPVGAVIVSLEKGVIARAHNQREKLRDPTAHAEMIAITQAANALQAWRLDNCVLYVTLEPCPMCAGAIVQARIPLLVYGAADPKAGACDTLYQITTDPRLNHRARVVAGVLADRCGAILSDFFSSKRRRP